MVAFIPSKLIAGALVTGLAFGAVSSWADTTLEERVKVLERQQRQQERSLSAFEELLKKVEVSGFLSVRGGRIDNDEITYAVVMEDDWSFSDETVTGLQIDVKSSEDLSMSMQLKAGGLEESVGLEWGYLEYAFAPDLKVRAGRLRAPGFMLSEYRDVGYAYPWVQVPNEVYGWLPFNRFEGIDLRYWMSPGDVDIRVSTYLGSASDEKLRIGNMEYADQKTQMASIDINMVYDIYTVRAGYSKYRFKMSNGILDAFLGPLVNGTVIVPGIPGYVDEVSFPGLIYYVENVMVGDGSTFGSGVLTDVILGLQADGDPTNDILIPVLQAERSSLVSQLEPFREDMSMNGERDGRFAGVGFSADNGEFMLMSEFSTSSIEGITPDVEAGYILFGYRFGNWMPHFTFAKMYTLNDDEWPDIKLLVSDPSIGDIVPGYDQILEGANIYAEGVTTFENALNVEQESYTLGVRWDPMAGLAIKAEVFMVEIKGDSYGFAFPKAVIDLLTADSLDLSTDLSFPEAENKLSGIRLAVDMVF
ncbi:MAG: hypothetical protein MI976_19120 [Pseudomonadales bacterium]|nr:hypothetical protein [Pseudomonadales bacterium]